jgi:hypothetical protein
LPSFRGLELSEAIFTQKTGEKVFEDQVYNDVCGDRMDAMGLITRKYQSLIVQRFCPG